MGYIVHHAIIVTSCDEKLIRKAHKKAKQIWKKHANEWDATPPEISEILHSSMNGYESFFIPPDGSKEGWQDSNAGDEARQEFLSWVEEQRYEDGSTSLDYAEVQYGDEGGNDKILQSTNVIGEIIKG